MTRLTDVTVVSDGRRPRALVPRHLPPAATPHVDAFLGDVMGAPRRRLLALAGRSHLLRLGARAQDWEPGLHRLATALDDVLPEPPGHLVVRLTGRLPHRKHVVQVLAGDGRVLAYVKVGADPHTRDLVRDEEATLRDLEAQAPRPSAFRFPRVLHSSRDGDLRLLVLSPLPSGPVHNVSRPPLSATWEVALTSEARREPLGSTGAWRRLARRLDDLAASAPTTLAAAVDELRATADVVASRHGDHELLIGRSHGDWTPRNARTREGVVMAWDWERSQTGIPIGCDAMHWTYAAARTRHQLPERAVTSALRAATVLAHRVGLTDLDLRLALAVDQLLGGVQSLEHERAAYGRPGVRGPVAVVGATLGLDGPSRSLPRRSGVLPGS